MIRKQKNSCHCIIIISQDLKAQLENGRNTTHTQSCSLLKNLSAQFLMQKNVERERESERERERESYSGMTLTSACDAAWIPSRNESDSASRSPLIR
jgi:hypothetical protein